VLVHEYSTVLLDLVCRAKGSGWQFFEAPKWFVQGYEEYLGLTCADAQAGKVRAILTSREPTFGRAIRTSLEVGVEQFGADWLAWLEKGAPSTGPR